PTPACPPLSLPDALPICPTDVMSFPMDELTPGWGRKDGPPVSPAMLGDIMLCPSFAKGQAERAGHSLAHELDLLTVHGVLRLLGDRKSTRLNSSHVSISY